ncbi:helix-turn-helix domain-containing protein [Rhizobium bangladeshense]|uniref:helix-turn-helix domain-containing protein n=1 Tax=Rhizobium bangladeshense TaxID=1138189 RepID=UPI001C831241|nr:helix-turn-helix transcriptional regulator [Rhizobium bangladeshense]MBX4895917.1 helix-turn-helix transcriptional regulator [Rhizobium bangladeshense]MBY3613051.1 helix-turn-helix transcriptional regulator [Rhizobium bangladeshense]
MIVADQIRAARSMLGLTQAALAKAAGLSTTGLNNIERGMADPKASTLRAIQGALEEAGIIFLSEGETTAGGRGVRLRG